MWDIKNVLMFITTYYFERKFTVSIYYARRYKQDCKIFNVQTLNVDFPYIWVSIADMFDNMVTFRKPDATIEFPTFDAATSGDIRFQFRTTAENGIFLQNIGVSHFIEVKLVCKYQ